MRGRAKETKKNVSCDVMGCSEERPIPRNYVEYLSRTSSMTVRTRRCSVHFDACVYTSGRCSERCAKSDKR